MLVAGRIDTGAMVQTVLTRISVLCCLLIACSFALFTHDQLAGASQTQQRALVAGAPSAAAASTAPTRRNSVRGVLDDVTHALTSPFRGLVHSSNAWVEEGIPTLLALLVYGLGVSFLARLGRGSP
jgi:hypothetical protein